MRFRSPCDFEYAHQRHEIVKAFRKKHRDTPKGAKQVTPLTCGRVVWRLGIGDDHRGAVWYDEDSGVLWLCAYRFHRSGEPDDAFPYFKELDHEKRLLPCRDDYIVLRKERLDRFAHLVAGDAQDLLQRAQATPNKEQTAVIGGEIPTGVYVTVVETLEELAVAMTLDSLTQMDMTHAILQALLPSAAYADWEWCNEMPTRPLCPDEVCCRYFKE